MTTKEGKTGFLDRQKTCFTGSVFVLVFLLPAWLSGQAVYLGGKDNKLYRYDPVNCAVKPLFTLNISGKLADLGFDASGNLYALNTEGKLYKVDTLNQSATLIFSFLNLQTFNALCSGPSNMLYVTGSEGFVYSYNLSTKVEVYLGDLGYNPTGGMLFFDQALLVMLQNRQLVKVDPRDFKRNQIIKFDNNKDIRTLFTAPSVSGNCERLNTFGSAEDGSLYQMDLLKNVASPHCNLMVSFIASASSYDHDPDLSLKLKAYEIIPSDCDQDNGQILIHTSGGMGRIRFSAGGLVFHPDSLLSRIGPGSHLVLIKDENDCIDSARIIMTKSEKPVIGGIQVVKAGCLLPGKVIITPDIGQGPMQYSLNDAAFQGSAVFDSVTAGNHIIVARDTHGCADTASVLVGKMAGPSILKLTVAAATCMESNGHLSLVVDGPGTVIKYTVDGGPDQTKPDFDKMGAGLHRVQVRDENGCSLDTLILVGSGTCPVYIPNVFTPNGDGKNDVFQVFAPGQDFKVKAYQVYGRWGNLIYEANGFPLHSGDYWWDGTHGGLAPVPGVYSYRIVLEFKDNSLHTYHGAITLIL